jgi:hypothetical protein
MKHVDELRKKIARCRRSLLVIADPPARGRLQEMIDEAEAEIKTIADAAQTSG